jgi:hypothetical protein
MVWGFGPALVRYAEHGRLEIDKSGDGRHVPWL